MATPIRLAYINFDGYSSQQDSLGGTEFVIHDYMRRWYWQKVPT